MVMRLTGASPACAEAAKASAPEARRYARQSGLSLLEIIVAMALLSIVMTLSVQSGAEMLERWQYRAMVKDVRNQIAGLPLKASLERRPVELASLPGRDIGLPEGWTIEEQAPLVFSRSGLCSAAEFALIDPSGRRHTFTVNPPDCLPVAPS
jgi:prepilin-type N-terminal cleavage/methylation domain-containing protein